ncbi:MAG TPA: HD domain-containing protein [Xanthobacteraceae bacterium]|nr:HD domain-containing protein [Xanthobacteraceae bacterium]
MNSSTATDNRPLFNFVEPLDFRSLAENDPLLLDLIGTRAFQRLRSIRFLGGIDYLFVPVPNGAKGNVRYTRYQHSLGVARLAILYCSHVAVNRTSRHLATAAALLHDIGHGPLSHSLEPVFEDRFDITHHKATELIISGDVALGASIRDVLRNYNVNVDRVLELIFGRSNDFDFFFSGPINFDTIEGILRSQSYAKPRPNIPSPETVTEAALHRESDKDRALVDEFWTYKDQVYRHIINSRSGVLADFACQAFMRANLDKVSMDDYFASEVDIFRKFPGLREALTSRTFEFELMQSLEGPIAYKARRFAIDFEADFFARADRARYKQRKEERHLLPREIEGTRTVELKQDLFDDDSDRAREGAF